ncbi:MAG TPA: hypothetical protein DCL77_03065 [Prolixibacteraceae bacterium]|nr:hypothetical protein [Prolixibacteraceae bacterium]
MEISFDHSYSGIWVLLALLAASGISFLLYFKNKENVSLSPIQKGVLAFLRFASLLLVFLFLLSPLMRKVKKIKQLPILAVALDNSLSVKPYTQTFEQLSKTIKDRFADDYQVEFWSFGEKTQSNGLISGNERRSDYGQMIKTLKSNYINKNIGALILVGDGIYNQGQNPVNFTSSLKFPVYSIGVGDTTLQADAAIRSVKTNKVAFLKNKFPIEMELKFSKLKNKMAYLDIENNGKPVYSSTIPIVSDDDFKLEFVNPEATQTGLQHYKIHIRPFGEELNVKNNDYEFVIQVLENKQRILMLSDGPHPDLGALRSSISELQNYETELVTGNDLPDSLRKYSLIVLNQLPSVKNVASKLLLKIKESRVPVLFLIGPNTLLEQFNTLDLGLKVASSTNTEEVQAVFDDNFSLFTLSNETKEFLATAPPLLSPFGNTEISPVLQNLAYQSIKNIRTSKSIMAFGNDKGRKVGFVVGEGLWRWRLFDFQNNGDHEAFNELTNKIVQYLSLKENEDNFNVNYPALFQETDNIELTAELYNDSYELVNAPDVNIRIKSDSLKEFAYTFDRIDNYYHLNVGNLQPGDYTFEAETQLGNQHFTEKGSFSIVKNEIELQNNQADFGLLYQLAQQTGGKFASIDNYGTLLDAINNNKQITVQQHQQTLLTEWINLKTLFFLLVLLLGIEWFFRKYWGIY